MLYRMYLLDMPGGYDILMKCFNKHKSTIQGFFDTTLWELTSHKGAAALRVAYTAGRLPYNYQKITVGQVLNLENWSEQIRSLSALIISSKDKKFTIKELSDIFETNILELLTDKRSKKFYVEKKQEMEDKAAEKEAAEEGSSKIDLNSKLEPVDLVDKFTGPLPEPAELLTTVDLFSKVFYKSLLQFITELDACFEREMTARGLPSQALGDLDASVEAGGGVPGRGSVLVAAGEGGKGPSDKKVKKNSRTQKKARGTGSSSNESSETRRSIGRAGGPVNPKVKPPGRSRSRSGSRSKSGSKSRSRSRSRSSSGGPATGTRSSVKTLKAGKAPPKASRRRSSTSSSSSEGKDQME